MLHAALYVLLEIVLGILVLNAILILGLAIAAISWLKKENRPKQQEDGEIDSSRDVLR